MPATKLSTSETGGPPPNDVVAQFAVVKGELARGNWRPAEEISDLAVIQTEVDVVEDLACRGELNVSAIAVKGNGPAVVFEDAANIVEEARAEEECTGRRVEGAACES